MAKASNHTQNRLTAETAPKSDALPSATGTAPEGEPRSAAEAASGGGTQTAASQGKVTKLGQIRALLAAPGGASLAALCDATGWQSHSVRAALTGLRKAGETIEKSKGQEGTTVYRIGRGTEDGQ